MKKIIALTLAAFMLLMLTACPQQEKPPPDESTNLTPSVEISEPSAPGETPELGTNPDEEPSSGTPETISGVYTLTDYVVVDDENCTFTVRSAYEDEYWGFTLKVLCENKTDKNLQFSWYGVSVNGYMLEPYWSVDVAAGKKANSEITFYKDDFEKSGITIVDEITFTLMVFDFDDWLADNLLETEYIIYPTQLDSGSVVYPERKPVTGETVLVDNADFRFIIEGGRDDPLWGYTLDCYIENKTAALTTFTWNNVSVNGYMFDTYFTQDISPGKRAYGEITFYEDDLKRNDIVAIEEVEFTLYVYNNEDWNAPDFYNEILTYRP